MFTPVLVARVVLKCSLRRGLGCFLLFLGSLGAASLAHAHPSPNTAILLDFDRAGVTAELVLPLPELELGFGQPLAAASAEVVPKHGPALREYLRAHVHPVSPDGQPWTVEVRDDLAVRPGQPPLLPDDLVAHVWMQPPAGAPLRKFTFHYDAIAHEVMSHRAFVFIRNDWNVARFASSTDATTSPPEVVGMIGFNHHAVAVDRSAGSWWRGFRSVLGLGVAHIAEGTDHLLFLLVLLLPAPLLVAPKRRWGSYGRLRHSLLRLFKIVTAFTVGHSLTLAFGALGWVRWPSQPIEILIAVSILVSALHAIRPIFPGREPWVAAGFGLIHGLAFAGTIAPFGFSPWYLGLSILSFNVGIELMQLAVVVVTVPWLILLSRTRFYLPVRLAGAIFGGVAALTWIGERAFAWPNPFEAVVNGVAHHAGWIVSVLAVAALTATWLQRRRVLVRTVSP